MITIACVFVLATAAAAVPLEHDPGSRCPPDVRSLENKCGLQTIMDAMYPSPSHSPPTVHSHNHVHRKANHFRRHRSAGSDEDMTQKGYVELLCKMYEAFDSCLTTGYQIPELCIDPDVLGIQAALSFLCGPGKQGFADYVPCLASVHISTHDVECQGLQAASLAFGGSILYSLNLPLDDYVTDVFSRVHRFWQVFCTPSVYKACIDKTYRKPCGEQAVRFMEDLIDFELRQLKEIVSASGDIARKMFSCDNTTSLTQLEDASSDPDDKPRGISQTQSMSGQCIQTISNIMPTLVDKFGRCGEVTQFAQIGLCACQTLQKFPASTNNLAEESYNNIFNSLCLSVADQYMKCTAVYESTCTDGVLSHVHTLLSSTCSGLASAVKNRKCWERISDFFEYQGNCSLDWQDVTQIVQFRESSSPAWLKKFIPKMLSASRCLYREEIGNLKKHAVSLCGASVVNDFVTALQAADLFCGDIEQLLKYITNASLIKANLVVSAGYIDQSLIVIILTASLCCVGAFLWCCCCCCHCLPTWGISKLK